jgi:hypothetical protein
VVPATYSAGSSTGRKVLMTVRSVSAAQAQFEGYLTDGSTTTTDFAAFWFAFGPR